MARKRSMRRQYVVRKIKRDYCIGAIAEYGRGDTPLAASAVYNKYNAGLRSMTAESLRVAAIITRRCRAAHNFAHGANHSCKLNSPRICLEQGISAGIINN